MNPIEPRNCGANNYNEQPTVEELQNQLAAREREIQRLQVAHVDPNDPVPNQNIQRDYTAEMGNEYGKRY